MSPRLSRSDINIIKTLCQPLEICTEPFAMLAKKLGISQKELLAKVQSWKECGVIRRFGVVLNHRGVGLEGNALVAWNCNGADPETAAHILCTFSQVSHCYQRNGYAKWPYQLYTMVHAENRQCCLALVKKMSRACGLHDYKILLTVRELKKTKADLGKIMSKPLIP